MTKTIARLFMNCFLTTVFQLAGRSQTTSYKQLCNEIQFSRTINHKWAADLYLGGAFSSTPSESSALKTNIQRYVQIWAHYYLAPRWKLTSGLAYFYNKDVPDIGQYFSPEWRISLQGIYYIHKTGYTLMTRMRGEIRFMMNEVGVYEDKVSTQLTPTFLLKLIAKFNDEMKRMLPFVGNTIEADVSNTMKTFSWKPIPFEKLFLKRQSL